MKVQQLNQKQLSRGWLKTLETWPNMLILGWIMTSHYRDSLHSETWVNTHKQQVQETQRETEEKLLSNRERSRKGSKSKRRSKISKSSTETVQVLLDRQMDRLYRVGKCVYSTVSKLISIILPKIMSPTQLPCFVFYLSLTTSWNCKIHSEYIKNMLTYIIYVCMYI